MQDNFRIENMTTMDQLKEIQEIEQTVWNTPPIPLHQTFTAIKNGGIMLGVYHNDLLIGFQYSFPGYQNGETYLCSHMLGVHSDYRQAGLGELLKRKQKDVARDMGYSLITWTYDPLESVNAYLNLSKLKGIGDTFYENHYGTMSDALNQGLPTDRFLVKWWIDSDYVSNLENNVVNQEAPVLLETNVNQLGFPVVSGFELPSLEESLVWIVPIPEDFQEIKKTDNVLAFDWRYKTREVFQALFEADFVATSIFRKSSDKISCYIFQKRTILNTK